MKHIFTIFLLSLSLSSMTIYDIKLKEAKTSKEVELNDYKGKVIMLVNTASLCGFTKQYAAMQKVWGKYRSQNFILIAIPTNDFGSQEPGGNKEISNFCEVNFGIDFIITEKITSKGRNKHPIFQLISDEFSLGAGPLWNFYKYIFSSTGQPIAWFTSITEPDSDRITEILEESLLPQIDKKEK